MSCDYSLTFDFGRWLGTCTRCQCSEQCLASSVNVCQSYASSLCVLGFLMELMTDPFAMCKAGRDVGSSVFLHVCVDVWRGNHRQRMVLSCRTTPQHARLNPCATIAQHSSSKARGLVQAVEFKTEPVVDPKALACSEDSVDLLGENSIKPKDSFG